MLFGYGGMNTEKRRSGGSNRNGRKQGGRKSRRKGGIRVRSDSGPNPSAPFLPVSGPEPFPCPIRPSAPPLLCVKNPLSEQHWLLGLGGPTSRQDNARCPGISWARCELD